MEIRRATAIEEIHPPIGNLLIRVNVSIIVFVAVNELKHKQELKMGGVFSQRVRQMSQYK